MGLAEPRRDRPSPDETGDGCRATCEQVHCPQGSPAKGGAGPGEATPVPARAASALGTLGRPQVLTRALCVREHGEPVRGCDGAGTPDTSTETTMDGTSPKARAMLVLVCPKEKVRRTASVSDPCD